VCVCVQVQLINWVIVCCQRNSNDVYEFVKSLQQVAGPMGMAVADPRLHELNKDGIIDYVSAIRSPLVDKHVSTVTLTSKSLTLINFLTLIC
jgi:hypothetical protein